MHASFHASVYDNLNHSPQGTQESYLDSLQNANNMDLQGFIEDPCFAKLKLRNRVEQRKEDKCVKK